MAGIKALVGLSFTGVIGLTFLMLGCALETYGTYWPLFVLIFYAICPIPHFIARRVSDDTDAASSTCKELSYFFTTGIVVSAFGLPIILARVEVKFAKVDHVTPGRCNFHKHEPVAKHLNFDHGVAAIVIKWGACGLVLAGNAVIFLTVLGFFVLFGRGDDFGWEQW